MPDGPSTPKPTTTKAPTYLIDDGVRRAKAADLAGQATIWARVGGRQEQKLPVDQLRSPKSEIDVKRPDELQRWRNVKQGMATDPDLLPAIDVRPGSGGVRIRDVRVVGERTVEG
jgi:hypothetical protein